MNPDLTTGGSSASTASTTATGDLPLDGIRVIDLTVVWSGPGSTALLGDLGAEVIRVEGNDRLSRQVSAKVTKESIAATGYHGGTYPEKDPGERPYDRSAVFNWHARNKLSACMNLDTPEGHQALLDLVAVSDVLVENNSNGVLEKLDLHPDTLLEVNPRLIVARMPPLGTTGPISDYLGYGPNFNSLVGIAAMDGYEGEEPDSAGENYHMDEAAPAGLAFAVMAALWDRESTGRGGLIEFAQAENVIAEIGEYVLDRQVNDRDPEVLGNADPHVVQSVVPAAGQDRWVAVSIRDDRDWRGLCTVLGDALDPALGAGAGQRRTNAAGIREALTAWCADREPADAVDLLQGAGVPAGEVMSEPRLLTDPHLVERGWFRERHHPAIGTHLYPGQPWRSDDFELAFGRPVPGFGQDNAYVYREVLGYDEATYDDLVARGLVTDHQIA
ncbi:CoA transferase [Nocardioides sp.]|uniref:CaiB/BaiF CoA transferase family protein n=1 Tax=Nocardioides sp. TaxID=35761 RepID=UPI002639760D|nr:CoA transferase [Nocardioides sp.]